MATIKYIQDKAGSKVFPVTHERAVRDSDGTTLETKLQSLDSKTYILSWDGSTTPSVANIPDGVTVEYESTTYTGTLAASFSTTGKIYLVFDGNNEYDRYITSASGATYSWVNIGSAAITLEVVDNLTSSSSTKALSAGMGKTLEGEISDLNRQLNGREIYYGQETSPATLTALTHIYQGYQIKIPSAGTALAETTRAAGTNYRNARVPVSGAQKVEYNSYNSSSGYGSMFVDADDKVISGHSKTSSESNPITLAVPEDAVYFIFSYSLDFSTSANHITVYYNYDLIPTGKIEDGAITSSKLADGSVTSSKIAEGTVDEAISGESSKYYSYNLLDQVSALRGYIDKRNGKFTSLSSGSTYATDFISVSGQNLQIYCRGPYGTYGDGAVYDTNKTFLRGLESATYTYQNGDGYVRWTYKADNGYQCILPAFPDGTFPTITGTFDPIYSSQTRTAFNGSQIIAKENIPSLLPAHSQSGIDGLSVTESSLTDGYITIADFPLYIKGYANISFKGVISEFGDVTVGIGYNSSLGLAVSVTSSSISLIGLTGSGVSGNILESKNHSLTIADFIILNVIFGYYSAKAILVTSSGSFVAEFATYNKPEHYGRPFVYAPSASTFTNVKLSSYLEKSRSNIWIIGDSYVSIYAQRWPYQIINTFGIDTALVMGLAGSGSSTMFSQVSKCLALGTPKYLLWCLGMNDNSWIWMDYAKQVEALCRERGITLIYQTIPLPTSGYAQKQKINSYIRSSGYRYIDACAAVIPDETTRTWYAGTLDDGVHPTTLGAKLIAGQVLVDFPEIIK